MGGLEIILSVIIVIAFIVLFIVIPFLAAMLLYKREWISDNMRYFLAISMFISSIGVAIIAIYKAFF